MNKITSDIVALVVVFSLAHDAEERAWERRNKDGIGPYRMAVHKSDLQFEILREACQKRGLSASSVYDYCRRYVGSGAVVLPNGQAIPFGPFV